MLDTMNGALQAKKAHPTQLSIVGMVGQYA